MKGQIPATDVCIIESGADEWSLLSQGTITELQTSLLIYRTPEQQVKVEIVINKVLSPEQSLHKHSCQVRASLGERAAIGRARTAEFLSSYLDKYTWIMFGYIVGEEKKPIFIIHVTLLNLSIYTQKLKDEEIKSFFPLPAPGQN